jgi:phenylacetate-CoA ligase
MSTQIILKVLALRHRLRQRDRWTRRQLEKYQGRALHRMREYAYARSLFYRRFHKGFTVRPLGDLPILTKEMVMEHFDELVTDPTVRLADVEAHLATLSGGRLNAFHPKVLVAYASMAHLLAEEQFAERLRIVPGFVFASSEVFTGQARRRLEEAWGNKPFEVYAATEPAGIASECGQHRGMHLFEDLVITEVVDENNKPVPPGVDGERVLVTVLFSRTMPLIRYEMSDSVKPASSPHCPCGRPFALIDGIQGREEDVLRFPATSGGQVSVQPIVSHRVMDAVPAGGWQVVQGSEGLTVLLSGVREDFADTILIDSLRRELETQGAIVPPVKVRRVPAIPRTTVGKAPLIKAHVPGPWRKP